jgi:heme o synthase
MLPVVAGIEKTRRHIFFYSLAMAAAAISPWPLGLAGPIYGGCAAVLSFVFLVLAGRVFVNGARVPDQMEPEKHLFGYSVFYLFALFAVLVADRWLAW